MAKKTTDKKAGSKPVTSKHEVRASESPKRSTGGVRAAGRPYE